MASGVAVTKQQRFHSDSSAKPFVFTSVVDNKGRFVSFTVGIKTVSIDRTIFLEYVEVPSLLPKTITTGTHLKPVRDSLAKLQAFAKRFAKSEPMLRDSIVVLAETVAKFETGGKRYRGKWVSKEDYAKISREMAERKAELKAKEEERAEKRKTDRIGMAAFVAKQREKGLEEFKGQWMPRADARRLRADYLNQLKVVKIVNEKSINNAQLRIFQTLDAGLLVNLVGRSEANDGTVPVSPVYIAGIQSAITADGEYYETKLYYCGSYTYPIRFERSRTVSSYCLTEKEAVALLQERMFGPPAKSPKVTRASKEKNVPEVLRNASATGSGFFVGNDGHFVTNHHVIEGATDIRIHTDGATLSAKVVVASSVTDLAILKINKRVKGLQVESIEVKPGSDVYAIGFPQPAFQGIEVKVTKGVVSSTSGPGQDTTRYQIDAAIQPGNSGGPLCDERGVVVGVVVSKLNELAVARVTGSLSQNVNYAIKSAELLALLRSKGIKLGPVLNSSSKLRGPAAVEVAIPAAGLVVVR